MYKNITFRISFADYASLQSFAESKNLTISEALRELIRSIGKQKTFEARLMDFMKKIESELNASGGYDTTLLKQIFDEVINVNKGLAIMVNKNSRNEWDDMVKIKKALYLLSNSSPQTAAEMKKLLES
ncbi:MAG: hypothetical protein AB7E96_10595 [Deferribacterales bacterium]